MDPTKPGFRLLSEREWEYVARDGVETPYSFGASIELLSEYGWYAKNSGASSHVTASLRPSVAGLFDIHGNLMEWTNDWSMDGAARVIRGGCWNYVAANCRSETRFRFVPSYRDNYIGFRVALSLSPGVRVGEADARFKGMEPGPGMR